MLPESLRRWLTGTTTRSSPVDAKKPRDISVPRLTVPEIVLNKSAAYDDYWPIIGAASSLYLQALMHEVEDNSPQHSLAYWVWYATVSQGIETADPSQASLESS